jgi:hypothetical protein
VSEWGLGPWGLYLWGLDYESLEAIGGSEGELEEDNGEKWGGSEGVLESDYDLFVTGEGGSSGDIDLTCEFLLAGSGGSAGEVVYEYLSTLAEIAAYVLNLNTNRTYQFSAYGFTGIGRFNGKLLGLRNNKIYDLETAATLDDATAIDAYIEIESDFGLPSLKQLRAVFFQDDPVIITITDTSGNVTAHTIAAKEFRSLAKTLTDESFVVRIANVSGSQITLRRFHSKLNSMSIKGE